LQSFCQLGCKRPRSNPAIFDRPAPPPRPKMLRAQDYLPSSLRKLPPTESPVVTPHDEGYCMIKTRSLFLIPPNERLPRNIPPSPQRPDLPILLMFTRPTFLCTVEISCFWLSLPSQMYIFEANSSFFFPTFSPFPCCPRYFFFLPEGCPLPRYFPTNSLVYLDHHGFCFAFFILASRNFRDPGC